MRLLCDAGGPTLTCSYGTSWSEKSKRSACLELPLLQVLLWPAAAAVRRGRLILLPLLLHWQDSPVDSNDACARTDAARLQMGAFSGLTRGRPGPRCSSGARCAAAAFAATPGCCIDCGGCGGTGGCVMCS